MSGRVHRPTHCGDIAGDRSGSFIVHGHHGADCVTAVLTELRFKRGGIHAAMPVAGDHFHGQAEALRNLRPLIGELPVVECHDFIAGVQRVHDTRFPCAGG